MDRKTAGSFSGSLESDELRQHVLRSYLVMRAGIAIIGIAFPLLLLFGGIALQICPQDSMSAYYHAAGPGGGSMRNWFVGLLFAVSISLGLYRGFSRVEDRLLDAAALLGIGIAIFPMGWDPAKLSGCGVPGSIPHTAATLFGVPLHYLCAISFFLCISLVCWFCADDTLHLEPSETRRRMLKRMYRGIAIAMPASMFAAWGLNSSLHTHKAVFWAEAAGIFAFGAYWFLKGIELNRTAADLRAARGELRLRSGIVEAAPESGKPPGDQC